MKRWIPNEHSDKQMSVAEVAYVAGMVDGEGYIGLVAEKRSGNTCGTRYVPQFSISGCDSDHLIIVRRYMGNGRISGEYRQNRCRPMYRLMLGASQIRHVGPQVRQYLVLKQQRLDLLLEYLDLAQSRVRWKDCDLKRVVEIYDELKYLNRRGNDKGNDPEGLKLLQIPPARQVKSSCSVPGCLKPHFGKGYCQMHYARYFVHPREQKNCLQCGKEFESYGEKRKYCSDKCGWLYRSELRRQTRMGI